MAFRFVVANAAGERVGEYWLGELDRSYRLPDGRRCPVRQAAAWCRDCRQFVAAERIPSPAEIEQELTDLRLPLKRTAGNGWHGSSISPTTKTPA
jgi:hypothetical protein